MENLVGRLLAHDCVIGVAHRYDLATCVETFEVAVQGLRAPIVIGPMVDEKVDLVLMAKAAAAGQDGLLERLNSVRHVTVEDAFAILDAWRAGM